NLLRRYRWLPYVSLAIAAVLIILLFVFAAPVAILLTGLVVAGALIYLWRLLTNWSKDLQATDSFEPSNQAPKLVDLIPKSNDFRLTAPGENFAPTVGATADN